MESQRVNSPLARGHACISVNEEGIRYNESESTITFKVQQVMVSR